MNLRDFAIDFRKQSGRFDLVNADGSDRGRFVRLVRKAQRFLDQKAVNVQQDRSRLRDIGAGDYLLDLPGIRRISKVYVTGPDGKVLPDEKTMAELRELFPTDWSAVTRSAPVFWARLTNRLAPDQSDLGAGGLPTQATYDTEDVLFDDEGVPGQSIEDTKGIALLPPADRVYTVRVVGSFWSRELVEETDTSFWSEAHPHLLYLACMYFLETELRNREGQADALAALMDGLAELDKDSVEMDFADSTKMKG